jgi:ParB/RepB/Spo0J family partition protein
LPSPDAKITLTTLDPKTLKPHPRYLKIYGQMNIEELVEQIQLSNWINPILITPKQVIISGHRRWQAALQLNWDSIPVEIRAFPNRLSELEALLSENLARSKTREQKVREANSWKEVESARAKQRQEAGIKIDQSDNLMDIFSEGRKGTTRDLVAAKVGIGSGVTYTKAAKVVAQIDGEIKAGNEEWAEAWRSILNTVSIQAAYSLLKLPRKQQKPILDLIATGAACTPKEAALLLAEESSLDDPRLFVSGDFAVVNIDPNLTFVPSDLRWNGYWGRVEDTRTQGLMVLNLGHEIRQFYSRDLIQIDQPSDELLQVASKVLRLRSLDLDELEVALLDVLQQRLEFTPRQLLHLEYLEKVLTLPPLPGA